MSKFVQEGLERYVKELQQKLADETRQCDEACKRAGERWKKYEAERQDHNITKRELAEAKASLARFEGAVEYDAIVEFAVTLQEVEVLAIVPNSVSYGLNGQPVTVWVKNKLKEKANG